MQRYGEDVSGLMPCYDWAGPSQLALSILLKYMDAKTAQMYYQDFKFNVIANWPRGDVNMTLDIKHEIKKILDKRGVIPE